MNDFCCPIICQKFQYSGDQNVAPVKNNFAHTYIRKLECHLKPPAKSILNFSNHTRLRRGHTTTIALSETTSIESLQRLTYKFARSGVNILF